MNKVFEKKGLTKKSENISDWYHDVVVQAGLADYSEIKGCMIIKPHGYALWEKVQQTLDPWFKDYGVQNVYFPIFIPLSLLEKEKEHVEGFAPELAIVTHAGGEKLAEPYVVRPTSETTITKEMANWIQSYRDLPLKLNQWANVVRWEKRTYPFLRTSEFLWQEGHTFHADKEDAMVMVRKALEWYATFYREYFAISPYIGIKSRNETFAGADTTYSIELVIPDGKALQAATSHYLGTNFTEAFEVQYLDDAGQKQFPHQTSWGISTRAIGGLILSHGDDSGLVLPPKVAPQEVVIVAVTNADAEVQQRVNDTAQNLGVTLKEAGFRVVVDTDANHSLGFRINVWELKGIPVRLEIGQKELESGQLKWVRRDTLEKGFIQQTDVVSELRTLLDSIQSNLLTKSEALKLSLTAEATTYEEFKDILENKKMFIRVPWCEQSTCEAKVKEETKATSRVLELDRVEESLDTICFACGEKASRKWLFARTY